jgi:hypothetical protein
MVRPPANFCSIHFRPDSGTAWNFPFYQMFNQGRFPRTGCAGYDVPVGVNPERSFQQVQVQLHRAEIVLRIFRHNQTPEFTSHSGLSYVLEEPAHTAATLTKTMVSE